MVDYCTTKQISTFVLALIGFSILVFFIEEYTEENEMQSELDMRNAFYKSEHGTDATRKVTEYPVEECWKHEKVEVIAQCTACKDFEIKAIKAAHCLKTGYYDRVNCSKSAITVLRPCASPKEARRHEFYLFSIFNFLVLAGSYVATTQRKAILDRAIYMRLPQHF